MVLALLATDIQYIGFNELRQVSLYLIFYLLIHPATLFVYNKLDLRGYSTCTEGNPIYPNTARISDLF